MISLACSRARIPGWIKGHLPRSTSLPASGLQELPQEAEVKDLELLVKVHADDAILTIDAQQDTCGFPVLTQDHLHLGAVGMVSRLHVSSLTPPPLGPGLAPTLLFLVGVMGSRCSLEMLTTFSLSFRYTEHMPP